MVVAGSWRGLSLGAWGRSGSFFEIPIFYRNADALRPHDAVMPFFAHFMEKSRIFSNSDVRNAISNGS